MSDNANKSNSKGAALESAVFSIERAILRNVPTAAGQSQTIDTRKIINEDGVRHEIDIYVTVKFAQGYSSVFIFECKNWTQPVGKNEIIVFSEKILASRAAHGYFVAKSFTSDARSQAAKDNRLTLLTVEEHDPLLLAPEMSGKGHAIYNEGYKYAVIARDGTSLRNALTSTPVTYRNEIKTLETLITSWIEEKTNGNGPFDSLDCGEHNIELRFDHDFEEGELLLNNTGIRKVAICSSHYVFVYRFTIEYSFDVHGRGRTISFAPVTLPRGGTVTSKFTLIHTEESSEEA